MQGNLPVVVGKLGVSFEELLCTDANEDLFHCCFISVRALLCENKGFGLA